MRTFKGGGAIGSDENMILFGYLEHLGVFRKSGYI